MTKFTSHMYLKLISADSLGQTYAIFTLNLCYIVLPSCYVCPGPTKPKFQDD